MAGPGATRPTDGAATRRELPEVSDSHPFERLTPDFILAAIEAGGVRCDGRLLALNSYENRVYQVGIEDAEPVIAKFYRPGRWTDAAIGEEHAFARELAEQDTGYEID